jgi:hypothetical protein
MTDEKIEPLPQWLIDMLDESGDKVFDIMAEQMKTNPDAMEALYG